MSARAAMSAILRDATRLGRVPARFIVSQEFMKELMAEPGRPEAYYGVPIVVEAGVESIQVDWERHVHPCPLCYAYRGCYQPCTILPELQLDDGTPSGSHHVCARCVRIMIGDPL